MSAPNKPNAGLLAYVRTFFTDWLSGMSGPLSVPFAALAVWSEQKQQKIIWGCLAGVAALFGTYRVWQRERLTRHAETTELQRQINKLEQLVERLSAPSGTEQVWAELVGQNGKPYNAQLRLRVKDLRVDERAMPIGRFIEGFDLSPMSGLVVEDGPYAVSFEFDGKQYNERVHVRGGRFFAA